MEELHDRLANLITVCFTPHRYPPLTALIGQRIKTGKIKLYKKQAQRKRKEIQEVERIESEEEEEDARG